MHLNDELLNTVTTWSVTVQHCLITGNKPELSWGKWNTLHRHPCYENIFTNSNSSSKSKYHSMQRT